MDGSIAFAGGIRKMLKQEQMADDISGIFAK